MGMFLRRSYFFIIIDKTINKIPSQIMFAAIQHWPELEKKIELIEPLHKWRQYWNNNTYTS